MALVGEEIESGSWHRSQVDEGFITKCMASGVGGATRRWKEKKYSTSASYIQLCLPEWCQSHLLLTFVAFHPSGLSSMIIILLFVILR